MRALCIVALFVVVGCGQSLDEGGYEVVSFDTVVEIVEGADFVDLERKYNIQQLRKRGKATSRQFEVISRRYSGSSASGNNQYTFAACDTLSDNLIILSLEITLHRPLFSSAYRTAYFQELLELSDEYNCIP